ncbi:Kinase superfamily protein [Theobroma cacao]|uniref:non-specific serine/threonine protein kinase n=1 Tax=Theobroma cacao TaxID=3641 RepID=A0A061G213_THECC|nr:Kinase superfamily protein [Theobroma cacao]
MLLPLFFLIFLSLFFMNTHGNNTFLPSTCPSHDCGNGLEIRYPFWHNDSDTPNNHYCGYPHFGLRCADNGQPIFSLPNDNFYVKNINYDDYTFTLVDIDVVDQTCPRARHNLTLGTLPLYHSDLNLNLSFYFNCSSHPSNLTPVKCLGSNDLRSYVVTEENDDGVDKSDLVISCEEKVEATVMKREINMNDLISGFGAAMNKGFVLDWRRMRECGACEASQGFCGYSNAAHEFLCFCKNGQIGKDHCLDLVVPRSMATSMPITWMSHC